MKELCDSGYASSGHAGFGLAKNDGKAIPDFVAKVEQCLVQVDVLVNNEYGSGVKNIATASADDFNQAYHTDVNAYFLLAREVVRRLRCRDKSAPGSIINIARMYGGVASYPDAYPRFGVNSAPNCHDQEGGLINLTRRLAVFWAQDGVRVNAISPGPFPSSNVGEPEPAVVDRLAALTPMQRMGEPEELKGLVVLLAGDGSKYITGQNILVDGGWSAW